MASALHLIVVLCVTSGLWFGAHAHRHHDHGWSRFRGHLYQFVNIPMEWSIAERHCNNLGGNLASFRSLDVYNFIREVVVRATGTNPRTWVGGTDASKEAIWLWSDGKKFDFTHWGPGEPNNVGGRENCMEINLGGQDYINDINCDMKYPFVCAKKHHDEH